MDTGLKDAVVVVTGGTSGIGLKTVRMLLTEGAKVSLCGRSEDRLNEAQEQLAVDFPDEQFAGFQCDVLDANAVGKMADATINQFGGVNVLINNAGQGRVSTFAETTDEAWLEELHLKFFSIIRPTRAFLPALERADNAAIVCVNSLLALQPEPHMVATSAARAGVLNLTRSLAAEFAPKGIRVNSILLGTVNSGQWQARYKRRAKPGESFEDWLARLADEKGIPLGRFGRPDEPARAITLLASPFCSYTTGTALDVSGGMARHI